MCLSQPKVPKAAPIVERQPYKQPAPFDSYASGMDPDTRRRMMAGVVTSAMGDLSTASTTRNPQPANALGGGTVNDTLGGGASSAPGAPTGLPAGSKPPGSTGNTGGYSGAGIQPSAIMAIMRGFKAPRVGYS